MRAVISCRGPTKRLERISPFADWLGRRRPRSNEADCHIDRESWTVRGGRPDAGRPRTSAQLSNPDVGICPADLADEQRDFCT